MEPSSNNIYSPYLCYLKRFQGESHGPFNCFPFISCSYSYFPDRYHTGRREDTQSHVLIQCRPHKMQFFVPTQGEVSKINTINKHRTDADLLLVSDSLGQQARTISRVQCLRHTRGAYYPGTHPLPRPCSQELRICF